MCTTHASPCANAGHDTSVVAACTRCHARILPGLAGLHFALCGRRDFTGGAGVGAAVSDSFEDTGFADGAACLPSGWFIPVLSRPQNAAAAVQAARAGHFIEPAVEVNSLSLRFDAEAVLAAESGRPIFGHPLLPLKYGADLAARRKCP
jgi:hypothetical protein